MRASAGTVLPDAFQGSSAKRQAVKDKFDFHDYAVIEKVSQLVHAVGRVSGGKGSAILISLPNAADFMRSQNQLDAAQHHNRRFPGRRERGIDSEGPATHFPRFGSSARHSSPHRHTRVGGGGSRRSPPTSAADKSPSQCALLLTTSCVFADRADAAGHTVTFLEQTVAGTAAQLGRQPRPITVAVRSDCGFVSSVADKAHRPQDPSSPREAADTALCQRLGSLSLDTHNADASCRSPSTRASFSPSPTPDETAGKHRRGGDPQRASPEPHGMGEETVEPVIVGYTLTYCDVLPTTARRSEGEQTGESGAASVGGSFAVGYSLTGSSFATAEQPAAALGWTNLRLPNDRTGTTTTTALVHHRVYPPGATEDMNSSCVSLGRYRKPETEDLFLIKPLNMPLLAASITPVRSGDVHLWVTHLLDGMRHYTLRRVAEVMEDCCLYEEDNDDAVQRSSGGVVFDANGDFVGLQHQEDGEALCIFTSAIVRHLFATGKLALCRSPIATGPPPGFSNVLDATAEERDGNSDALPPRDSQSGTLGLDRGGIPGSISSTSIRAGPMQVADFQQLLDARLRRERQMPVTQRVPTTDEVFKHFYTDFRSLSRMLHAFSYNAKLTETVLAELCKHEYRRLWDSLATSGAVGLILEIIDGNADNEALVTTSLSALAQLSIFDVNVTVFVHVDGVPTVLEIMKEYIHAPDVLQWGAYCLVQATAPTAPFVTDTIECFTRNAGVELAIECLRQHGAQHRHLTLWMSTLIAHTLQCVPEYITVAVHEDLPRLLMQHISDYSDNFSVLEGLLRLLHTIVSRLTGVDGEAVGNTHSRHRYSSAGATGPTVSVSSGGAESVPTDALSTVTRSEPSQLSERRRHVSSLADTSGEKNAAVPTTVERNAFFVRRAFARHERLVWHVLSHVCDVASRVSYSTRSVDLMQLSVETLELMVQWGFLPMRRVRGVLTAALARTEANYPTATTLLDSFRRCEAAIRRAVEDGAPHGAKASAQAHLDEIPEEADGEA